MKSYSSVIAIRLLTYRNRDNLVIILPDISHFIKTKLDQTEFSPNISCLKCAPKMRQKGGGWYGKYKENGGEIDPARRDKQTSFGKSL